LFSAGHPTFTQARSTAVCITINQTYLQSSSQHKQTLFFFFDHQKSMKCSNHSPKKGKSSSHVINFVWSNQKPVYKTCTLFFFPPSLFFNCIYARIMPGKKKRGQRHALELIAFIIGNQGKKSSERKDSSSYKQQQQRKNSAGKLNRDVRL
jgi:hypothetical protein